MHTHITRKLRASASSVGSGGWVGGRNETSVLERGLERSQSPRLPPVKPSSALPVNSHRGGLATAHPDATDARLAEVRFTAASAKVEVEVEEVKEVEVKELKAAEAQAQPEAEVGMSA